MAITGWFTDLEIRPAEEYEKRKEWIDSQGSCCEFSFGPVKEKHPVIKTEEDTKTGKFTVRIKDVGTKYSVLLAKDLDEKTYNILMYYLRQVFDVVNKSKKTDEKESD